MSATTAEPDTTTAGPTASQVWRSLRLPVVLVLLVVLTGLVVAAFGAGRPSGLLDPRAATPDGSRAVAQLLRAQGVQVDLVRTTARMSARTRPGDTLLVTDPELLVDSQAKAVRDSGADLVLVTPATPERFVPALVAVGPADDGVRAPGCLLPAARRAGTADAGGATYTVDPGKADDPEGVTAGSVRACYAHDGDASLVRVTTTEGPVVTVLGNGAALTNRRLDDVGNASLALGLLGVHDHLVWYLPSSADVPTSAQRSLYDLVPDGVWWALVQVGVAVVLLGLWRARRLGPVVTEPLPVVVRATETVAGRGRLYRRSGARDKAALTLRAATLARLAGPLGLPRRSEPAVVADAVAARCRRTPEEVGALLYGAAPADDTALVRLADELDNLEKEVGRP